MNCNQRISHKLLCEGKSIVYILNPTPIIRESKGSNKKCKRKNALDSKLTWCNLDWIRGSNQVWPKRYDSLNIYKEVHFIFKSFVKHFQRFYAFAVCLKISLWNVFTRILAWWKCVFLKKKL